MKGFHLPYKRGIELAGQMQILAKIMCNWSGRTFALSALLVCCKLLCFSLFLVYWFPKSTLGQWQLYLEWEVSRQILIKRIGLQNPLQPMTIHPMEGEIIQPQLPHSWFIFAHVNNIQRGDPVNFSVSQNKCFWNNSQGGAVDILRKFSEVSQMMIFLDLESSNFTPGGCEVGEV